MRSVVVVAVVLSALVSGCSGKRGADAADALEASPSGSVSPVPPPRAPFNHTEVFDEEGNVMVGARGVTRLCGGLSEHGVAGVDAVSLTWDVPRKRVGDALLTIRNLTMWAGSNAYGHLEAVLFGPEGDELGLARFSGLGGQNESISLTGPISEGEYRIEVRVCGPDTTYRVHGEARYQE